jgi:hypothetical protein
VAHILEPTAAEMAELKGATRAAALVGTVAMAVTAASMEIRILTEEMAQAAAAAARAWVLSPLGWAVAVVVVLTYTAKAQMEQEAFLVQAHTALAAAAARVVETVATHPQTTQEERLACTVLGLGHRGEAVGWTSPQAQAAQFVSSGVMAEPSQARIQQMPKHCRNTKRIAQCTN